MQASVGFWCQLRNLLLSKVDRLQISFERTNKTFYARRACDNTTSGVK